MNKKIVVIINAVRMLVLRAQPISVGTNDINPENRRSESGRSTMAVQIYAYCGVHET